MNRITQLIMVSIFFIGFPAVSWYYLNQGYNYRISVIEELNQQLGKAPAFKLINQTGKSIDNAMMQKKVIITNFVALEGIEQSKDYMQKLYSIQDQFDKKDDILFYTYVKADSLADVQQYVSSLNIKQEQQWNFLTGSNEEMEQFIRAFPLPENSPKVYVGNPTVAIADTSSVIRYFYDMGKKEQVSQLVVHIANLMPQAPPEEARMKRELEK